MLYDPKWNAQADFTSLEALIAWLETKPANGRYVWEDCEGGCLIGLFGAAMGLDEHGWGDIHSAYFERGDLFIAGERPHTFGAVLKRARAALSATMCGEK